MTIELKPEHVRIIDEAIQAGLIRNADEVVAIALEGLQSRLRASPSPVGADDWMRRFRAWAQSHPTTTPLLSDEAISRESIYHDHGE